VTVGAPRRDQPDLRTTLRALKLGQMLPTLPDRLTLARQQKMTHAGFLELVLADEVTRREAKSAGLRARAAGLNASMRLDTWDESAAIRYDRQMWNELVACASSTARTARCSSAQSGPARPTWPAPWAISPCGGGGAACTWQQRPSCSSGSKQPGSTTAPKPKCAAWPEGNCSSSTTSRYSPSMPRDRRLLRDLRRAPPAGLHRGDLEQDTRGMAVDHGRPAARPIRRRPARLHRPRTRHRRRVLPAPPETIHHHRPRHQRVR
jgi:IstB-like ATP binding protein